MVVDAVTPWRLSGWWLTLPRPDRGVGGSQELPKLPPADVSCLEDLIQRAGTELLVARDYDGWLVIGMLQREMAALAPLDPPALALQGLDRLIT